MLEVCSVLGALATLAAILTAVSEILPFCKRISGNGILHTIYHIFDKRKCNANVAEL